jgi:hypothetical protein
MDNFDHYTMRQGMSRYIFTGKSKKCGSAGAYHLQHFCIHMKKSRPLIAGDS